jgi:hypothetical protein
LSVNKTYAEEKKLTDSGRLLSKSACQFEKTDKNQKPDKNTNDHAQSENVVHAAACVPVTAPLDAVVVGRRRNLLYGALGGLRQRRVVHVEYDRAAAHWPTCVVVFTSRQNLVHVFS